MDASASGLWQPSARARVEILEFFLKAFNSFLSLRVVAPESGSQWRSAGTGIETLVLFLTPKKESHIYFLSVTFFFNYY